MSELEGVRAMRIDVSVAVSRGWRATPAARRRAAWLLMAGLLAALAVLVAIRVSSAPPRAGTDQTGWSSVPLTARGPVSAAIGADEADYRVSAVASHRFQALNSAQGLRASFGPAGIWLSSGRSHAGLHLVGIATGGSLSPVGEVAPRAKENRVVYAHPGVVEWYANGPMGVEQGFTVARPPVSASNAGRLILSMALSGDLRPSLRNGSVLFSRGGRPVLAYRDLVVTDARGRQLGASLKLRGGRLEIDVDTAGAAYPVRVDPFVQQAKLTASDGVGNSYFGRAVAVSSNGSTVVVGAPLATVGSTDEQGAAYVFTEPAAGWASGTQTTELTEASLPSETDFGEAVAVSGDGSTVIVGANDAPVDANSAQGAAYVFSEPTAGWATQPTETSGAELTAAGGTNESDFATSLAISSDGSTVVAGATEASPAGAAYVFSEPTGGWSAESSAVVLTASDGTGEPFFGDSLAISGDGSTVVVGAPLQTVGATSDAGEVYIFSRPSGGWASSHETAKLTAPTSTDDGGFGESVAASADGSVVATGDPGATVDSNTDQGAVDLFSEPAGGWASYTSATTPAQLTAADGASQDDLGDSVAVSGDGTTVVAGAPLTSVNSNAEQGALYVFSEPAGGWVSGTSDAELTAADGTSDSALGDETAISSDGSTILAGDFDATVAGTVRQGAAYVFGSTATSTGSTTTASTTTTTASTTTTTASTTTATSAKPPTTSKTTPLPPTTTPPRAATASVGRVTVRGTRTSIPLTCSGSAGSSCTVKLSLSVTETLQGAKVLAVADRAVSSKTKKRKKVLVLASATTTLLAGHSHTLVPVLDAQGERLLTKFHTLRVRLVVAQVEGRTTKAILTRTVAFRVKARAEK